MAGAVVTLLLFPLLCVDARRRGKRRCGCDHGGTVPSRAGTLRRRCHPRLGYTAASSLSTASRRSPWVTGPFPSSSLAFRTPGTSSAARPVGGDVAVPRRGAHDGRVFSEYNDQALPLDGPHLQERRPDAAYPLPPLGVRSFLVLDEADRVVDANFEEDLKVIFDCLPKKRQTFLFSATMSDNLRSLLELSGSKSYFFEAYEGFKTVENLKQQYIHIPPDGKELHLLYLLSKMKEDNIRSAIVFVSTCRTCQYLDFVLQELGRPAVSLHSHKAQSQRLSALHRFKSGQVPVLIATDVASRGLDIQTVDLVINYDIPRFPRDYIHRVGRTARATRGGLSISFVTQRDICLLHEIEDDVGNRFDAYECDDKEVTKDITKVFKARRLANMRMADEGHDDKVQDRKDHKKRDQARKRKHDE